MPQHLDWPQSLPFFYTRATFRKATDTWSKVVLLGERPFCWGGMVKTRTASWRHGIDQISRAPTLISYHSAFLFLEYSVLPQTSRNPVSDPATIVIHGAHLSCVPSSGFLYHTAVHKACWVSGHFALSAESTVLLCYIICCLFAISSDGQQKHWYFRSKKIDSRNPVIAPFTPPLPLSLLQLSLNLSLAPFQALALVYSSPQEATFLLCHGPDNIVDDTGPTRTGTRNSGDVEPYEAVFQASLLRVEWPQIPAIFQRGWVDSHDNCGVGVLKLKLLFFASQTRAGED